jgi:hypothetical protein
VWALKGRVSILRPVLNVGENISFEETYEDDYQSAYLCHISALSFFRGRAKDDTYHEIDVPSGLTNVVQLTSGNYHGLVLIPTPTIQVNLSSSSKLVLNWSTGALQWAPTPTGPSKTSIARIRATRTWI